MKRISETDVISKWFCVKNEWQLQCNVIRLYMWWGGGGGEREDVLGSVIKKPPPPPPQTKMMSHSDPL